MFTTTTKPTAHAIAPAPYGVKLEPQDHARLIVTMVTGRGTEATPAERTAGIRARNAIVTAYWPWIAREATRTSPSAQASEDRAAEAVVRCIEALAKFDPAKGVPLSRFLVDSHSVHGEAVALAGMPGDLATRDQRRGFIGRGLPIPRPSSLEAPIGGGDDDLTLEEVVPSLEAGPEELAMVSELKGAVAEALSLVKSDHREILIAFYGLDGSRPMKLKDIALLRGITESSTKRRLESARQALAAGTPSLAAYLEN
ncbi:sigma-70 family RNA polymerase sigma factor [Cryobacterium sp. SO1]|uniref:sigma-70 family RNA polymerase sigma factor n=1 Tax=Cryobacterium sp. SO1 TaxID=1897061 RepID=UPI0010D4D844|nr:sigma-70 family RNA polymerase sigma factor [Cryobacterium sp. SO1]RZI36983.1 RNA polymerase sigma factor RpoS [Cryobacterium sp. SO1]